MTEPAIPSSACAPCSIVHLHVDADRDGSVDDRAAPPRWTQTSGAILLVNCDNDDGKSSPEPMDNLDCADQTINGATDLAEIAPLDLRKSSEMPLDGVQVILSLDTTATDYTQLVRIFSTRTAGGTEIIGPNSGPEKTFSEADFNDGKIELGMEAIRFPSRSQGSNSINFDGRVPIRLRVVAADGTELHTDRTEVHVAPWFVSNHADVTEVVYVAEISGVNELTDNDRHFLSELRRIIGSKLEVVPVSINNGDRWAQDIMEIGHSAMPGKKLVTAIRTPNLREQANDAFAAYPGKHLLSVDLGFMQTNDLVEAEVGSSLDSFGNLECSPPLPGYPFGRIVYGAPDTAGKHASMREEMRALLEGNRLQSAIRLDTGWLSVGHVDEFLCFIPDPAGTHGFRVAFASPNRAMEIVRQVHSSDPNARLFDGIRDNDSNVVMVFLDYANHSTVGQIMRDRSFMTTQGRVQQILNTQKEILRADLGLSDSDFIDMPILFHQDEGGGVHCVHARFCEYAGGDACAEPAGSCYSETVWTDFGWGVPIRSGHLSGLRCKFGCNAAFRRLLPDLPHS